VRSSLLGLKRKKKREKVFGAGYEKGKPTISRHREKGEKNGISG